MPNFLHLIPISYFFFALSLLESTLSTAAPLGLPELVIPAHNPQTPEKIALGDKLFHDNRLSSTGEVACQSCHLDGIAFHDGRPVPRGVNMAHGTRNAPTVINAAYMKTLFWDGRVNSLEQQAHGPLLNPVEHGLKSDNEILDIVRSDPDYISQFQSAFSDAVPAITITNLTKAIACYERTIIAGNSSFDRWYFTGEQNAISDAAKRGFIIFIGAGHCANCHRIGKDSALFTDQQFHNINVSFDALGTRAKEIANIYLTARGKILDHQVLTDKQVSELGRFTVSKQEADIGAFITPSLRNIARTAPYFHDGSLNTLAKVVSYFNNGGSLHSVNTRPNRFQSPLLKPLGLDESQQADLVAFLRSLTSPEFEVK